MKINPKIGLLDDARQCPSPNQDARPTDAEIDLLVIHNISLPPGQYGGPWIEALFTNTLNPSEHEYFKEIHQQRVSAHLLIRRDGELIQFVSFNNRAWHAGVSEFNGRIRCNDFSIGIELEGCDDDHFEPVQYQKLADITKALQTAYPDISAKRITAHSDIASGRKTDPGPHFDWEQFRSKIES